MGTVTLYQRLTGPTQVQGFPDLSPSFAWGEADHPATQVAVDQVVAEAELIVQERRITTAHVDCSQQDLSPLEQRSVADIDFVGYLHIDGGP